MSNQAYSSVFTTMRWDGECSVAHFSKHIKRLEKHSLRVGIDWPENAESLSIKSLSNAFKESMSSSTNEEVGLVSLRLTSKGDLSAETRWIKPIISAKESFPAAQVVATALPAPHWNESINGCKHGDWQPYIDAKKVADERGCGVALFVRDDALVDGSSATPLLLDDDGVAWYPDPAYGGVDSISISTLIPRLLESGIPVSQGRLTKLLLSRAKSVLVVGTGVGVLQITHLDGQKLGDKSTEFASICHDLFNNAISESWFKIEEVVH